ncbi:GGDEF domain-containing protein [Thiohalophilus sp.]|uniref:GGDEF domain-containing protein n=1 Tax=Thiohalophilus sp. TaxID=3028392 RepID=UPI002ACE07C6|nr:GGDEF domain-containing protein [Thiohalophilus sp.]MDZ7802556.1 GGDEF domain-containing protein [Thiohalophilus sp.]
MNVAAYALYDSRDKGRYMPLYGLLSGMLLWLLDAMVDVYVLQVPQTLVENLIFPPLFDIALRSGIIVLMVALGVAARRKLKRQESLQQELLEYKNRLEELIELRAEEVRNPADSVNSEITVLKDRTRDLEEIASIDGLTRFYNRRKFGDLIDYELARQQRYHHSLSLILVDIDRFCEIAAVHGQATSEHVIRSVASRIHSRIRATDIPARWSEDEFAILIPETRQSDARRLAQKLVKAIDGTLIDNFGLVSISCGVTEAQAQDNVEQFTDRCVEAVRLAREGGGNRVEVL